MNKKKNLSAKKIFGTLIFFSIIFFNGEKIFAEENRDLNKKIQEIKNEITKLDKGKNFCDDLPKKISKKSVYKPIDNISDSFDETFFKEKYQISEKGINIRNKFLDDVSVGGFKEIIDSFTIQFSGNYCYQRDLQKIDKLLYWSIDFGAKLAEKCQTGSVVKIKKIIGITNENGDITKLDSIKMLKKNFEKEDLETGNFYNYKGGELYSLKFGENLCKEDSITDTTKKIKKLGSKFSNIGSGILDGGGSTIKFFSNIWDMFSGTNEKNNDLKKFLDKIEKDSKKEAQSYLTSNLNKTLQGFGIKAKTTERDWCKIFGIKRKDKNMLCTPIKETVTKIGSTQTNKTKKEIENNKKTSFLELKGDIKNFLQATQTKKQKSDYAKYAKENFDKNQIFNELEEDATNKINSNLAGLEADIIMANGNPKELNGVGETQKSVLRRTCEDYLWCDKKIIDYAEKLKKDGVENKDLKTLRNFILEFSKFLKKHNEEAGPISSKGILNYGWESDYGQ